MHRAIADTLEGALALAYQNNPQINAQRAATRATDEGVGVALSGYRPTGQGDRLARRAISGHPLKD